MGDTILEIVANPVTLGAAAVTIGGAADAAAKSGTALKKNAIERDKDGNWRVVERAAVAVTQSSTTPEDRKTCVRRLAAWSNKLKREHKHLYTAMLTVHSLVSGALFGADVGTDAVATTEVRAKFGHDSWEWKLMAAFIALPIVLMWLGLVRLVWKKRDNGHGPIVYRPTLLVVIFGLPAVLLLDVLMLLLKVPGIGDALRSRLPNDSKSTITNNFMNTYSAARTLVETLSSRSRSLPFRSTLPPSTAAAARWSCCCRRSCCRSSTLRGFSPTTSLPRAKQEVAAAALCDAAAHRWGAFENGVNAIYGNAVASLDLSGLELNHEQAAALSEALKSNSTLEELDLQDNKFGVAGAQSLAGMLQVNRALKSANLAYNDIGDGGAIAISAALESNITLTNLNFTPIPMRSRSVLRAPKRSPKCWRSIALITLTWPLTTSECQMGGQSNATWLKDTDTTSTQMAAHRKSACRAPAVA